MVFAACHSFYPMLWTFDGLEAAPRLGLALRQWLKMSSPTQAAVSRAWLFWLKSGVILQKPNLKILLYMSYSEFDALQDEQMNDLYEQFKMQYESEFTFEKIEKFYTTNRDIVKAPLKNLSEALTLFENQYFTPAFTHAIIAIEIGIKSVLIKPILYSLVIDCKAGDLLYSQTFKYKSLQDINVFYYDILEEFTKLDFKKKRRDNSNITIWDEWKKLQKIRNEVFHQGISVEKTEAENAINMASYVLEEIIPTFLDVFYIHIEDCEIKNGSRDYISHRNKLKNK